jgi:hypothetical protein
VLIFVMNFRANYVVVAQMFDNLVHVMYNVLFNI